MTKIFEIAFSGFWAFTGIFMFFYTITYFLVNGILTIWNRFMRMLMVRKHGWPPEHLDADGDWKKDNTEK